MKDTFHPPSRREQNRLLSLFTNFPAVPQSFRNGITAVALSSELSAFAGISRQEGGIMRRPFKLNPVNGKSQSMTGSAVLAVMSSDSLEEA